MLNEKSQESVKNPTRLTILGLDRSGLSQGCWWQGCVVAQNGPCWPTLALLADFALVCLLACLLWDLGEGAWGKWEGRGGPCHLHSIPFQLHETNFG